MDTANKQLSQTIQLNNLNSTEKAPHCNGTDGGDSDTVYYGVHIPSDIQIQDADGYSNVFQDKLEALKIVKKYKKARFKAFNFYHEAVEFAMHGSEFPNNNTNVSKSTLCGTVTDGMLGKENTQPTIIGEKPPPFRGPKSQDLVKLRKGIENGQLDIVQTTIWDNPRYLISSGDTPSILQEGSRYNALHVAAKAKNRDMCELILNTVGNTSFMKLLYGDDSHQDADERAKMLVDLYLNTPDKGLNETPLHFAVKFGAVEVVELLVSFPQCDKTLKNKFGKSPSMIICDRCEGTVPAAIKNKISMLLEETYYVPVLRAEDNCIPPLIGEPFAPNSPPSINKSFLNPRLEIHAYAGPMNKEGAEKFRRIWKTPPRSLKFNQLASSASDSQINSIDSAASLKFKDLDKGLERMGRALATKFEVGWKEYWPFLNNFVDLASSEGLEFLENYLAERVKAEYSCASTPKYTSSSESDLISNSSPKIRSKDINQDNTLSPISDLCKNLEACHLNDNSLKKFNHVKSNIPINTNSSTIENQQDTLPESQLFKPDLNPFLCVEKSCQVFANRISNDILHLLERDFGSITVRLETEIKQLELLMASFMDDSRFVSVDFHLVHYRLGCLITCKLKECLLLEDEYDFMKKTLEHWLENCSKHYDYFSSDDESVSYRQTAFMQKKSTSKNKQVVCLLECILNTLTMDLHMLPTNINNEDECVRAWGDAKPCACIWQTQLNRRSSLVKKANSFKYTSRALATTFRSELENVSRQLCFGDDENVTNNVKDHCDIIINKSINHQRIDNIPSDEEYFTPPSSPLPPIENESDEDDLFEDSFTSDTDVFIEGNIPTKTDYAVYNAIMCVQDRLNPKEHPNIYKWRHAVSLYPEEEQRCWSSPNIGRCIIGSPVAASTPPRLKKVDMLSTTCSLHTPSSSWLRITGANSPRGTLKPYRRSNISFNL